MTSSVRRFYGLLDHDLDEVIEFYPSRDEAEEDLAAILGDEPGWVGEAGTGRGGLRRPRGRRHARTKKADASALTQSKTVGRTARPSAHRSRRGSCEQLRHVLLKEILRRCRQRPDPALEQAIGEVVRLIEG